MCRFPSALHLLLLHQLLLLTARTVRVLIDCSWLSTILILPGPASLLLGNCTTGTILPGWVLRGSTSASISHHRSRSSDNMSIIFATFSTCRLTGTRIDLLI